MTGRGFFITGTNTDVGKTVFTRGLARLLTRRGIDVAAIKPVESGVASIDATDAAALNRAAGALHAIDATTAYRFSAPLSPHLAAALAHTTVDPERITTFLADWLVRAEVVLAEGAGGLLVPLTRDKTYGDLIAETDYSLIIVAPNVLGTINATLLTIEAARARGIAVDGVVLNRTPSADFGNADAISRFGNVPILGEIPDVPLDDDRMADILGDTLDLARLNLSPRT